MISCRLASSASNAILSADRVWASKLEFGGDQVHERRINVKKLLSADPKVIVANDRIMVSNRSDLSPAGKKDKFGNIMILLFAGWLKVPRKTLFDKLSVNSRSADATWLHPPRADDNLVKKNELNYHLTPLRRFYQISAQVWITGKAQLIVNKLCTDELFMT